MTTPTTVVMIHGISVERAPGWHCDWSASIESAVGSVCAVPVNWEKLTDRRAIRPGRIPNFVGDIAAIFMPSVVDTVAATIHAAARDADRLWVLGHSLGSVLAYHVASTIKHVYIDRLITIGSPLWRLEWWGLIPVVTYPRPVRRWHNVWGVWDWVVGPFWRRWLGMAGLTTATRNWSAWCDHDALAYLRSAGCREALR